ncbi:MAG: hypothetical protein GF333_04380 [Candidatus Omnitrophica bacterium]|nr:hypothetical protein [Candidatus Omnitrophota bacterium]
MKKTIAIFLLILFVSVPAVYAEYAELVGKRVELHGPFCWDRLGLGRTEQACEWIRTMVDKNGEEFFVNALRTADVLYLNKNEKALVLDLQIFEQRAKVLILTGVHTGVAGWVPLKWLDGNECQPRFSGLFPCGEN